MKRNVKRLAAVEDLEKAKLLPCERSQQEDVVDTYNQLQTQEQVDNRRQKTPVLPFSSQCCFLQARATTKLNFFRGNNVYNNSRKVA